MSSNAVVAADWRGVTIPIPPVARSACGSTSGEKADMARRARRGRRGRESRRGGVVLRGKIRKVGGSLSSPRQPRLWTAAGEATVKESLSSPFARAPRRSRRGRRGRPLRSDRVSKFFDGAWRKAPLPRNRRHDLRHTCAALHLKARGTRQGRPRAARTLDDHRHDGHAQPRGVGNAGRGC